MKSYPLVLSLCFVVFSSLAYYFNQTNPEFSLPIMIGANIILAAVSFISFRLQMNGIKSNNGEALYRAKIASTMLKFFTIIGAVLIYVFTRTEVAPIHQPTFYYFGAMYIVYMVIETVILSKLAKVTKK